MLTIQATNHKTTVYLLNIVKKTYDPYISHCRFCCSVCCILSSGSFFSPIISRFVLAKSLLTPFKCWLLKLGVLNGEPYDPPEEGKRFPTKLNYPSSVAYNSPSNKSTEGPLLRSLSKVFINLTFTDRNLSFCKGIRFPKSH